MFDISPSASLATSAGIGLRSPHMTEVLERRPAIGWLEVHTENFLNGGQARQTLEAIRKSYPVSLHGVGLSLGSAKGLDLLHLRRVKQLVDELQPALVSDHLSWSACEGVFLNDLLPLPYVQESLDVMKVNIFRAQDALGRTLLIENPSAYLKFAKADMSEAEFLAELARSTGCFILLDLNNLFVSASNLGFDALRYLDALPKDSIGEFHVAGHHRNVTEDGVILIDDHGSSVGCDVWHLYGAAVRRFGPRPTLIERDSNLPALDELIAEAGLAQRISSRNQKARAQ
jgi:uncharacterized protein (UPF0276 family)